ncbi:hypothetical protein BJ508DRAFT_411287 [Ascobolus immersus RN42]|uniref:F-box domain-containing protein n=1 Tax=Ascobolus immersus RN42 TaxID=1160509 RepID=A0A3N4IKH7_ASCIM|nr:hypothetical protein BJ508DRAFT_411287 [Ascobolus immersus RN42]
MNQSWKMWPQPKVAPQPCHLLNKLPPELQLEILLAVDVNSVFQLRATCKRLRYLIDSKQTIIGQYHARSDFLESHAKRLLNFRRPGFLNRAQKTAIISVFNIREEDKNFLGDRKIVRALIGPFEAQKPSTTTTSASTTTEGKPRRPRAALSPDPNHFGLRELQVMQAQYYHIIYPHMREFARWNLPISGKDKLQSPDRILKLSAPEWIRRWISLNSVYPINPITPAFLYRLESAIYNIFITLSCFHYRLTVKDTPPLVVVNNQWPQPASASRYHRTNDGLGFHYDTFPPEKHTNNAGFHRPELDEYELLTHLPTVEEHTQMISVLATTWFPHHARSCRPPLAMSRFFETHFLCCRSRIQHGIKTWSIKARALRRNGCKSVIEFGCHGVLTPGLTKKEAADINYYATDPGRDWHILLDAPHFPDFGLMQKMYQLEDLTRPAVEDRITYNLHTKKWEIDARRMLTGEFIGEFWNEKTQQSERKMVRSRDNSQMVQTEQDIFEAETQWFNVQVGNGIWDEDVVPQAVEGVAPAEPAATVTTV